MYAYYYFIFSSLILNHLILGKTSMYHQFKPLHSGNFIPSLAIPLLSGSVVHIFLFVLLCCPLSFSLPEMILSHYFCLFPSRICGETVPS